MKITHELVNAFVACLVSTALLTTVSAAEQPINLVTDGDFERRDLALGNQDKPGAWVLRNHGAGQASVEVAMDPEENGGRCLVSIWMCWTTCWPSAAAAASMYISR